MALWKGTALPVWKSLFFLCPVSRQAEMAPREQFHQSAWFSISISIAKLRWEEEVVGGQGSTKPHCGCSLLLTRAPPKHSQRCAHSRAEVLQFKFKTWGEARGKSFGQNHLRHYQKLRGNTLPCSNGKLFQVITLAPVLYPQHDFIFCNYLSQESGYLFRNSAMSDQPAQSQSGNQFSCLRKRETGGAQQNCR